MECSNNFGLCRKYEEFNKGLNSFNQFVYFFLLDNLKYVEALDSNWFLKFIFRNGSFAIDSYFFCNGVLLCQIFFVSSRELKIHNVKGISEHFQHYFLIVAYKILKMTLPYLSVIVCLRMAMKHFNENSILSVPSNDHFTCNEVWKNLIFLDVFIPYSERVIKVTRHN